MTIINESSKFDIMNLYAIYDLSKGKYDEGNIIIIKFEIEAIKLSLYKVLIFLCRWYFYILWCRY